MSSPNSLRRQTVDTKTPPVDQLYALTAAEYFAYGAELMKVNPPHLTDWSMNVRMKRIGFEVGRSFDAGKIDAQILARGAETALKLMQERAGTLFRLVNGWYVGTEGVGVYGNDYIKRAVYPMLLGVGAISLTTRFIPSLPATQMADPLRETTAT